MDRVIALVALRFRLELRAVLGARSRFAVWLLALPALAVLSAGGALMAFSVVEVLSRRQPELLLPVLSALAVLFGLSWTLSPLLAGVAATESHDLTKLLHYPVPLASLVTSSLLANLAQPIVLAQVPPLAALALALAGPTVRWPFAFLALAAALAFTLASGQAVGLALHAVSRRRRWHDRLLLLGIALSVAISLVPILILSGAFGPLQTALLRVMAGDAFALIPFSWGVRSAVYLSHGEALRGAAWGLASLLAVAAAVLVSTVLAGRLYRGQLDLGLAAASEARPARMPLPGAVGALVEKDLRTSWRDPRRKALVFTGLIGPLLILAVLWQAVSRIPAGIMLALATANGLGVLGQNAIAAEGAGLPLLLGFPVARMLVLVAKNLSAIVLRLPAVFVLAVVTGVVAGPVLIPAAVTIAIATQIVACGIDNFVSLLFPVPVPSAGRNPNAALSGTRGLGTAFVGLLATAVTLAASGPFAFLAWLPHLLGAPALWLAALPLALAGAAAVYFMLASAAGRLLERRETDLVARATSEE